MIRTVAGRELRSLFLSPLAWTILAVVQLIMAWLFLVQLEAYMRALPQLASVAADQGLGELVVAPLLQTDAFIMLLVVPMITMRLFSEERRSGTLTLLLSSPLSAHAIVLGKYLAVMGFLLVQAGLVSLMPLSLLLGGQLDMGILASALLGLVLILSAFAAAGLFLSALTEQPAIAAVSGFGVLLLLWILDWAGGADADTGPGSILGYLSLVRHLQGPMKGVFDTQDVVYYLLFTVTFLVLATRRLDNDRLQG